MSKKSRSKKSRFLKQYQQVAEVEPKSTAQAYYMQDIKENIITFGVGSAGTGKTYVSTAMAGDMLYQGDIDKIIVTRPAVEAGEKMGFLPGSLEEKFEPYLAPIREVFIERFSKGWYETQVKNKNIEAVPLGYMQGLTFNNSVVLADEMENSTPKEMFMLLSRVGEYSKVLINGDYRMQKMIRGKSGLEDAIYKLEGLDDIAVFEFVSEDIVRSGIAKDIIQRYENS